MCVWLTGLPEEPSPPFRCIVEIRFMTSDTISAGSADFPLVGTNSRSCCCSALSPFFCLSFLCRRRGAVHHAGHADDDGRLVDVRAHRHLLVHSQPSSLPHHHAHRELHTVSVLEVVFHLDRVEIDQHYNNLSAK